MCQNEKDQVDLDKECGEMSLETSLILDEIKAIKLRLDQVENKLLHNAMDNISQSSSP